MAKSVKWLFIAGSAQCLSKCWFHVKIEVEYSYRPISPVKKKLKMSFLQKKKKKKILIFVFCVFKALQCTIGAECSEYNFISQSFGDTAFSP